MDTNNIEEARKVIEEEKQLRLKEFQIELEALCNKYKCSLTQGQIVITAN
jgi:hypothetical protein